MLKQLLPCLFLSLSAAPSVLAEDCSCEGDGAVLTADSTNGRSMRLRFEDDPVTTQSSVAFLCHRPTGVIARARLFMPAMGHGSTPTRLVATRRACTRIERIDFMMSGSWEIQTTYGDGDSAVFTVDVQ